MELVRTSRAIREGPVVRRRFAFTLIELMVVVSIIALLAMMLVPSLLKAVEAAKAASCMSNMRYTRFAFTMYAQDNNDFIPPWSGFTITSTMWPRQVPVDKSHNVFWTWFGAWDSSNGNLFLPTGGFMYPYWGKADIGGCPSLKNSDFNQGNANAFRTFYGPVDYALNTMTLTNTGTWTASGATYTTIRISDFASPDKKALIWDSARWVSNAGFSRTPWGYPTLGTTLTSPTSRDPNFHGRHLGGRGNVGWVDGHVSDFTAKIFPDTLSTTAGTGDGTNQKAVDIAKNIGNIDDDGDPNTNEHYDPKY